MAAVLTLAGINDLKRVAPLVAVFHLEVSLTTSDPHRKVATTKLLDGTPLGALYLIGPRAAPVGHIATSHGLSSKAIIPGCAHSLLKPLGGASLYCHTVLPFVSTSYIYCLDTATKIFPFDSLSEADCPLEVALHSCLH